MAKQLLHECKEHNKAKDKYWADLIKLAEKHADAMCPPDFIGLGLEFFLCAAYQMAKKLETAEKLIKQAEANAWKRSKEVR